jgi:hypothetical protein
MSFEKDKESDEGPWCCDPKEVRPLMNSDTIKKSSTILKKIGAINAAELP